MIFHHISKKTVCILFLSFISLAGCKRKNLTYQDLAISVLQKNEDLETSVKKAPANITDFIDLLYGPNCANLSRDDIFIIQDLLESLWSTPVCVHDIAQAFMTCLSQKEQAKSISPAIISYLKKHIEAFLLDEKSQTCDKLPEQAQAIAKKIIQYVKIEQSQIFTNEKNTYIFLQALSRNAERAAEKNTNETYMYTLPNLINFWNNSEGHKLLAEEHTLDLATIQSFFTWKVMGEMAIDMGVMMATMQGASLANEQLGKEGSLLANIVNKNSQTIQTGMQAFQQATQKRQQNQMQSMMSAFGKAQQNMQEEFGKAATTSALELDYLYKNISVEQPQQNYIFNQVPYDQLFTLGSMATPDGTLWKNAFCVGDWEYDKDTNSFWQYQLAPLYNESVDDQGNNTKSSLQAENNAIFAEYFTNAQSYTIEGSITLYNIEYPFFAGIIFNKSRWISGDFESIRKCRMLGIYGNEDKKIAIYFAQQYTMTEEQMKTTNSNSPIQTPLQQIVTNQLKPSIILPKKTFASLPSKPVTLNFILTTTPTAVMFKFWNEDGVSKPITITKLDPGLFMYHDIGLVSPGAITQFTLKHPSDFVFSAQAVAAYKE